MWKRLLILAVTLFSVSSIVCGYYAFQMDAAGGYQSGGNLTGRVNKAPAGLSTSALAKGDKFILNIQGTTSQPLTWLLVYNSTSKTWMSASIESMGSTNAMDDLSNMALFYYRNSKMKAVVDILNNRLTSYPLESFHGVLATIKNKIPTKFSFFFQQLRNSMHLEFHGQIRFLRFKDGWGLYMAPERSGGIR